MLICFSLTAIAWLAQSLRFIDLIVNRGLGVTTFLYLSSLLLPSLFWIIVPLSLFIGVIFVYHKLSADSELVVLRSAGISAFGQIKPALIFAFLITMFSYLLSFYLLPASSREFKDMQVFIRDNYASLLLQEGVFASPAKGLTVYIRERSDEGMMLGTLVHDTRSPNKSITMMAEEGQLVQGPSGPRFILLNGNRQEIDRKTGELSLLYFERYALELSLFGTGEQYTRWREPQERYLDELFNPKDTNAFLLQKLRAEGHHRITWPLYNILLTLLALTIFIIGQFDRQGNPTRVIISVVIAIILIILGMGINSTVAENSRLTFLMYLSPIGGISLLLLLLLKDPKFKVKAIIKGYS